MPSDGRIADLPALSEEEQKLAAFRARDVLWALIGDLFDRYREEELLTFAALGRRVGRSRSQVQRWLSSPNNLTLQSAGLLAEGLDADFCMTIQPRVEEKFGNNYSHPCETAAATLVKTTVNAIPSPVNLGSLTTAATSAPSDSIAKTGYTWQQLDDA